MRALAAGEDNGLLEEPPLLQIRRSLRRPSADVLARFKDASTGFLADCMDGRGALDWRIKPVDPGRAAFAGAALPCLCGPGDNLALLAALSVAQPGDAIMAAGESFEGLAICGDRVAGMARNRGAVAIGPRWHGARHARHPRGRAAAVLPRHHPELLQRLRPRHRGRAGRGRRGTGAPRGRGRGRLRRRRGGAGREDQFGAGPCSTGCAPPRPKWTRGSPPASASPP